VQSVTNERGASVEKRGFGFQRFGVVSVGVAGGDITPSRLLSLSLNPSSEAKCWSVTESAEGNLYFSSSGGVM